MDRISFIEISALSSLHVSLVGLRRPTFIPSVPGLYHGCQPLANSLDQPSQNWQRVVRYVLAPSQGTQRHCLTINQVINAEREIKALIAWVLENWLLILLCEVQGNGTCCSVAAVYGAVDGISSDPVGPFGWIIGRRPHGLYFNRDGKVSRLQTLYDVYDCGGKCLR